MFDRPLKVLMVSSEVVPFAKTGGLADVIGSLPKALATIKRDNSGNDVRVTMPHYKGIEGAAYRKDFPVLFNGRAETAIIREAGIEAQYQGEHRFIPVYMIDNHYYFYREGMYTFPDEAERFAFFCRAVLEMVSRLNWQPDVIHCNDWQSGPIPFFLKVHYQDDPFYNKIATVFTIHNLQYQGNFPKDILHLFGVGEEYYTPDLLEFFGKVSFMKMGVLFADVISTVSKTYAQEIQRPEFGERLDGLLRKRSSDLYGIINGINYHEFDPKTDPRIHRNYDQYSIENKVENKFSLQKEMGLEVKNVPVIGMISRLFNQKGLELVAQISDSLLQRELQLVLLGSGDPDYEDMFRQIKARYPDKVGLYIGFNAVLAQRIYAGADMFLMPSRFEPCGLGQLIAMRYGTIPIARATGGLADTVYDYNPFTGSGSGFLFSEYDPLALYQTINRALKVYHEEPEKWKKLVRNAMEMDYSWARSAVEYIQLYQEAINRHRGKAKTA